MLNLLDLSHSTSTRLYSHTKMLGNSKGCCKVEDITSANKVR
jgi:hypothetical protein